MRCRCIQILASVSSQSFFKLSVLNMPSARKAEEGGVAVATSTDDNAADGGIGSADN